MPEANKSDPVPQFVLDEPATFEWPVRVPAPAAGRYQYAEFTAIFANLVGEEFDALVGSDPATGLPRRTDREVADQVLQGWSGLGGPAGTPLPYTPENKARLLGNQRARLAVVSTFLVAARGVAAEKN